MKFLIDTLERVPEHVVWEITNACNLRCVHCESSSGRCRSDELSTLRALQLCDEIAGLGARKVHLTGGEPLVRKDWTKIARRLKYHGLEVTLMTNGLLLDDDVVSQCVQLELDTVTVSLDGTPAIHDSIRLYPPGRNGESPFRMAFQGMTLARSKGLKVMVITHINGRNIDNLAELHSLLKLIPIDAWQIQLGIPAGRAENTESGYLLPPSRLPEVVSFIEAHQDCPFPILATDELGYYTEKETSLRRFDGTHFPFWVGCYAGVRLLAIEADGVIKGCPSMPRSMAEGSLSERSLTEIWECDTAFPYNRQWDSRQLRGFCSTCDYRFLCRAGCRSFCMATTGTIHENHYCLHRLESQRRNCS